MDECVRLARDRAVLLITHRVAGLTRADEILVLSRGTIVACRRGLVTHRAVTGEERLASRAAATPPAPSTAAPPGRVTLQAKRTTAAAHRTASDTTIRVTMWWRIAYTMSKRSVCTALGGHADLDERRLERVHHRHRAADEVQEAPVLARQVAAQHVGGDEPALAVQKSPAPRRRTRR
jgi:ABC-type multidrug transport system ATPase subunit